MSSGYINLPISGGVTSLNDETGAITLVGGSGITIVPSGNNITINSSGVGSAVVSINGDMTSAQTLTVGTLGNDFAIVDNGSGGHQFDLPTASATKRGALSSADWSTFNGKQNALTFGNLTDAGTDGITITGGTGAVIGSGTSISQHVADSTHNGYLSSTDWTTFNSKQSAGNYITALTGDVTATGPGSVAATIANLAVTNAKIANATIDLTTKVTGVLPIANGGTGSATKNFVDLTTAQNVGGTKTFTNQIVGTASISVSDGLGGANSESYGNAATTNGADNSLAVGANASSAVQSVAVGVGATILSGQSIAIGQGATASFLDVVIGQAASSTGFGNNVVIGGTSTATGNTNLILGYSSNDGGFNNVNILGAGTASAGNQTILGGCNTLYLGKVTNTSVQSARTINVTERTGTNVAAATSLTIKGPRGTGTGTPGDIILATYTVGTSGSTPHVIGTGVKITSTQRMGVFQGTPTAQLHIAAGTATANTAPLKFTSGTLLTTPEAGAIEYDGVDFYATRTTARRKISLSNDSVTSDTTVANTTTETTIFTTTIGANGFKAGDVLRTNIAGYFSTANGSDTFTMRYKIGSTTILSITSDAANVTNAPFHAELITTIRSIGAGGTLIGYGTIASNNVSHDTSNTTTTSIDTTATMTFTVTIQWSSANASDTFTQTIGFDEFL